MQLLKATRDTVLRPLTVVSGIIERRNTMPILANVLIRQQNGKVAFIGSDSEVQITTHASLSADMVQAESETQLATTVAARKLLDILRALPESRDVALDLDEQRLIVSSGKSRFALQTLAATEFPETELPPQWDASFTLPQKDLKQMFGMVHFAMAHQDIRYYLNALLLVLEPGLARAVATDGHRLAHAGIAVEGIDQRVEAIIPRKTINELHRLFSDTDDPVQIDVTEGRIRFTFGTIELVSKLVEGKFPDFMRVIPTTYTRHFTIDRELLQGCLQRAAILTPDKLKGVRLQIADGRLKVTASNTEQEEAREELDIEYAHEPLDVGFNVTYLLDVLANIKEDTVRWSVEPDVNASALITLPNDDQFKYVVMPMRI